MKHSVVLLYHYFHPDDVVSARLFSDLAEDLTNRGYDVTAMPAIRSCHDGNAAYAKHERWSGGTIQRVWRPPWSQKSNRGRVGNALFILLAWTWRALTAPRAQVQTVVIGTDPILGVLAAIPWRILRRRCQIIHWCHDVYPQAAVADDLLKPNSFVVRVLNWWLRRAYRRCDVVADLGNCMRTVLQQAIGEENDAARNHIAPLPDCTGIMRPESSRSLYVTLPPWSLVEPQVISQPDVIVRRELFGNASLGLLYSGNLGRAHLYRPFLDLARQMRSMPIAFCFGGRGPRMDELQQAITADDQNIRFAGFAPENLLALRLEAADIHMVSLQDSWTGTVVPSKFFGSLAAGRPVLFAGSKTSAIARWIAEFQVGWVINSDTDDGEIAEKLRSYANDPEHQQVMKRRCHDVYVRFFSRSVQLSAWDALLSRTTSRS